MGRNIQFIAIKGLLSVLCFACFSFSSKHGGDSFEIWLNGKMMLQQFVHVSKGVQTVQLISASGNETMDVYYRHCGQTGTERYITIKDENDHPLKVWKFADVKGSSAAMSIKLKDILTLKKNKNSKLDLFYSSRELPNGRLLALLAIPDQTSVAKK